MTFTCLYQRRRDLAWVKLTLTRSHTRLRPALREQGTTNWYDDGVEKTLVRRWHGEVGKFRLLVQVKTPMTSEETAKWHSPGHLKEARSFK